MIDRLLDWWMMGIIILIDILFTSCVAITTIILTITSGQTWVLFFNFLYIILIPPILYSWKITIDFIKEGGIL